MTATDRPVEPLLHGLASDPEAIGFREVRRERCFVDLDDLQMRLDAQRPKRVSQDSDSPLQFLPGGTTTVASPPSGLTCCCQTIGSDLISPTPLSARPTGVERSAGAYRFVIERACLWCRHRPRVVRPFDPLRLPVIERVATARWVDDIDTRTLDGQGTIPERSEHWRAHAEDDDIARSCNPSAAGGRVVCPCHAGPRVAILEA